jgi:hypothetical protein
MNFLNSPISDNRDAADEMPSASFDWFGWFLVALVLTAICGFAGYWGAS